MKKNRRIQIWIFAFTMQILLFCAFAEQEDPLRFVDLSEGVCSFSYIAPTNGEYSVCIWSEDGGEVSGDVRIEENSRLIAGGRGRGTVCAARFAANREYVITVEGTGSALIEVARNSLSRSYSNALEIEEDETKGKMISRGGDVHWYRFTAIDDSNVMLVCEPESPELEMNAFVLDDRGTLISEFEVLSNGVCMTRIQTKAGRTYRIRVCADDGKTGYYEISSQRMPKSEVSMLPAFDQNSFVLSKYHVLDLSEHITGDIYLYTVSDPYVCAVSRTGEVTGLHEGKTRVTAYGCSTSIECEIEVAKIPIESISIMSDRISLREGEETSVSIRILPENASSGLLIYTTEDPSIASVSDDGIITGIRCGRTVLHVVNADGSRSDSVDVVVTEAPRKYRALLIGEENYPERLNDPRPGTRETIDQIRGMLDTMCFDGETIETSIRIDASRSEVIAAIRDTLSRANERDVSIVYISCHGVYFAGACCLQLTDGTLLDMRTLESELRKIPGRIVLLLDCCASGGAIGIDEDPALFSNEISSAISTDIFPSSKYLVLCSTSLNQDSYRITRGGSSSTTTAFARAICDAGGWDLDIGRVNYMSADSDGDLCVTFSEVFSYTYQRVARFMRQVEEDTGEIYRQSVCTNAPLDPLILFSRSKET